MMDAAANAAKEEQLIPLLADVEVEVLPQRVTNVSEEVIGLNLDTQGWVFYLSCLALIYSNTVHSNTGLWNRKPSLEALLSQMHKTCMFASVQTYVHTDAQFPYLSRPSPSSSAFASSGSNPSPAGAAADKQRGEGEELAGEEGGNETDIQTDGQPTLGPASLTFLFLPNFRRKRPRPDGGRPAAAAHAAQLAGHRRRGVREGQRRRRGRR